mmetsp:Transcript_5286/g.12467  ORF Transcript_5286/g.12467 Transcript_5286/m.12467 type:complete len:107 (+) Transcript_5286:243-563(+)
MDHIHALHTRMHHLSHLWRLKQITPHHTTPHRQTEETIHRLICTLHCSSGREWPHATHSEREKKKEERDALQKLISRKANGRPHFNTSIPPPVAIYIRSYTLYTAN